MIEHSTKNNKHSNWKNICLVINRLSYGRFLDPYIKCSAGGKTTFFSNGHSQQKVFTGKEFSGMGCLKMSKGQNQIKVKGIYP